MIVAKGQVEVPKDERDRNIVLRGIPWDVYQALRTPEENNHLRMIYDRGVLEIMSPSRRHEQVSYLLGRFIDEWTLLHNIDIAAGRAATFSRKALDRGLEPDNCYWISNEAAVRDGREIDLTVDPPPDLALEVEVSRTTIPKLPIYAAIKIPEVWQWKANAIQVLRLDSKGGYQARKASVELPGFPIATVVELLRGREGRSETVLVKQFIRMIRRRK